MFSTLLVPTDGSPLSERALPYAAALARSLNSRIILLRAAPGLEMIQQPELGRDPSGELDAQATRLRATGVVVEPHLHYVYSLAEVADTIERAVRERGADLIVMSTHGRSGLGRWIYGSVADAVLRRADVPVLLVPPACDQSWPDTGPRRLLVPLDGSDLAAEALAPASALARALGAAMTLLQVIQPLSYAYAEGYTYFGPDPDQELAEARSALEQSAAALRAAGLDVEIEARLGPPPAEITAVARERGADLIVMSTHGRGGLARVVLGSVATTTLQQARVPLLLVRPTTVRQERTAADAGAPPRTATPEQPQPGEPRVTMSFSPAELELLERGLGELHLAPDRDLHLAEPARALRSRVLAARAALGARP